MPTPHRTPRSRSRRRAAFTLVEVMIVVVAMAIIAGVVIPQVGSAIDDAKESAMLADLHMLTKAIERYKLNHFGRPPDTVSGDTLPQLVSSTNENGQIGEGSAFPFRSYLLGKIPPNPLNDDATVREAPSSPPPDLGEKTGWWYHKPTGQLWGGEKRTSLFPRA